MNEESIVRNLSNRRCIVNFVRTKIPGNKLTNLLRNILYNLLVTQLSTIATPCIMPHLTSTNKQEFTSVAHSLWNGLCDWALDDALCDKTIGEAWFGFRQSRRQWEFHFQTNAPYEQIWHSVKSVLLPYPLPLHILVLSGTFFLTITSTHKHTRARAHTHTHYEIACTPQRSKLVNTICL